MKHSTSTRLLRLFLGALFSVAGPRAGEAADNGDSSNQENGEKRRYTKILQMYDPGLWFGADQRHQEKGVEKAAQQNWRDMLQVPHERPATLPRPSPKPRRATEEDEDEDSWLRHITDPDSTQKEEDPFEDPWEDDVLSDPYKHIFGHDVEDVIEQMAAPRDAEDSQDAEQDEETEGEEEEEDFVRGYNDDEDEGDGSRMLNRFTTKKSDSERRRSSERLARLDLESLDAEELARMRLEQGLEETSQEEEKQDTLLTKTWATLNGAGAANNPVRSSSDGLLSQTRGQLATMAGGFSIFKENKESAFGETDPRAFTGSARPITGETGLPSTGIDESRSFFAGKDESFAGSRFFERPRFDDETRDGRERPGSSMELFGKDRSGFGTDSNSSLDDRFVTSGSSDLAGSSSFSADTSRSPNVAETIRQSGPVDRFNQSDPFGAQSDRFNFLD